jgi:hypothetical protein
MTDREGATEERLKASPARSSRYLSISHAQRAQLPP